MCGPSRRSCSSFFLKRKTSNGASRVAPTRRWRSIHQVDFELVSVKYALDEPYLSDLKSGKLKVAEVDRLIRTFNNVAHEIEIIAKVVK
jgi:hypothetical protein